MFALFNENGPYQVNSDLSVVSREFAWSNENHLLYIDSPVGTGYSFTKNDNGYARNQTAVANDLFEALQQFFTLFNEYQQNDFYLTGESYAGKYVPALGYKIATEGSKAKMNLKGLVIGNGLIDPITQLDYASLLYQIGFIDENEQDDLTSRQNVVQDLIEQKEYLKASWALAPLVSGNGNEAPDTTWLYNVTNQENIYNFIETKEPNLGYYAKYITSAPIRQVCCQC